MAIPQAVINQTPEKTARIAARDKMRLEREKGEPRQFARQVYNLLMENKKPILFTNNDGGRSLNWKSMSYLDVLEGLQTVSFPQVFVPEKEVASLKFTVLKIMVEEAYKKAEAKGKPRPGWWGRFELLVDAAEACRFTDNVVRNGPQDSDGKTIVIERD